MKKIKLTATMDFKEDKEALRERLEEMLKDTPLTLKFLLEVIKPDYKILQEKLEEMNMMITIFEEKL